MAIILAVSESPMDHPVATQSDAITELALLRTAARAATVRAVHRTDPSAPRLKCARLGAAAFTRLLGPLRELMERKAGESYAGYR
jgi:cAMP-dependent protein kinase regulator